MTDILRIRTGADIKNYTERGLKCELWGVLVSDMNRDELLGFIGFLDELATDRYVANVKGSAR